MSTTITSDNGIEIEVVELGLSVIDHEDQTETWVRLTPEQRRALADALDQGSAVVIGGRLTAPESQFKPERDDLRRQVSDLKERRRKHVEEREAWTRNRRELESARDAAVARAEAAEARTAPAVTPADIEKAIRGALPMSDPDGMWAATAEAQTRAVCALFGVEAEQATDPVDELAEKIETATRAAIRQACDDLAGVAPALDPLAVEQAMEVTAVSRKVAAHVLGQEEARDGVDR